MTLEFRDLTAAPADIALLADFYRHYELEFPDPDERESLDNMLDYLRRKEVGWYGPNSYHIVLAISGTVTVGCSVSDYLAEPNTGVIEFLLVTPQARRGGTGRALLAETERLLDNDARAGGHRQLAHVVAEINDPRAPTDVPDNLDPAVRALIWGRWGYRGLDFPYTQPALSADQGAVTNLLLIVKSFVPSQLTPDTVRLIVHEYLHWAMRINEPDRSSDYQRMAEHLRQTSEMHTLSLAEYVGVEPKRSLHVHRLTGADDPELGELRACYRRAFGNSPLAVPESEFDRALTEVDGYHLWTLRDNEDAEVAGMVSLFGFEAAGLCGYVALEGRLRGRFRALVARIECALLRDRPTARGWYVEVGCHTDPGPFLAVGFEELVVDYRQPGVAEPVRLLFKPFGRRYGPVSLPVSEVRATLAEIMDVVYHARLAPGVLGSLNGLEFARFH
ncbi:GNAT family N-acetyltransferase [Actinokineospora diospyrosa]|uniref:N-acetyltransferase domain-containing protein n=1 Tax=Actinokineospora diospyrosa TaxID=103728 RepID=A0ABT1I885_9PSEU|nr:GNAT family N-acetyltransferase [Actinokineospora diospyrosa]MCP2268832.1 hypothetical protein [Actinokineospora diospyrosa]